MKIKKTILFFVTLFCTGLINIQAQNIMKDIDGNIYKTITIGAQTWMSENLKTTKYQNGDLIGTPTPATKSISGESTPKFQWAYNSNENLAAIYGRLYTWYAVTDNRNICPAGWHVPTDAEWIIFTTFLGGENIAGGKLKEAGIQHWRSPNEGATNETGFKALPAGYLYVYQFTGWFALGQYTGWWSSSEYNTWAAPNRYLIFGGRNIMRNISDKRWGLSVRCVQDDDVKTSPIIAKNSSATEITSNGARINEKINANNQSVTVKFDYGSNVYYGKTIDAIPDKINGSKDISVNAELTDLIPNTIYHYRVKTVGSDRTTYGPDLTFTTINKDNGRILFNPDLSYGSVRDYDGNSYKTIKIGKQIWMAENLKTTHFHDGTAIPNIIDNSEWGNEKSPRFCWYNNDSARYKNTYGALYNWYTAREENLCPKGWHVPGYNEWKRLIYYLGGDSIAGGKLKEAGTGHWHGPNSGSTNKSGFTALPGGVRDPIGWKNGSFNNVGNYGTWWSAKKSIYSAIYYDIGNDDVKVGWGKFNVRSGYSIRCVKGYTLSK